MTRQTVTYATDDRIATIALNRPEKLNAIDHEMVGAIMRAVATADADPEVRVIILKGNGGKAFSTGFDFAGSQGKPRRTLSEWRARMREDMAFNYSVWDCSKPVIAMIEGYCLAGALELATCVDIRYCAENAQFGAIESRFSRGVATMMLPWILGQNARELIYTGDTFGAAKALEIGLVSRVFPTASLEAEVTRIARRMSRVSLECLRWNKRAINQTFETMGLRNAVQYGAEACAMMNATGSPEADHFFELRQTRGLSAALKWRKEQFEPFE